MDLSQQTFGSHYRVPTCNNGLYTFFVLDCMDINLDILILTDRYECKKKSDLVTQSLIQPDHQASLSLYSAIKLLFV